MLLDFRALHQKYGMKITGVIHAGAHTGEEAPIYDELGIREVFWIEANPKLIPELTANVQRFGHVVIEALLLDRGGEVIPFNVTNVNGMSSSVFEFGTHPTFSPEIRFVDRILLTSHTIDELAFAHNFGNVNMLSMDLQGAEGLVLAGAIHMLPRFDVVMSEVNQAEVYVGCTQIGELDQMLGSQGLKRVETYWVPDQGWGDALWVRTDKWMRSKGL